MVMSGYDFLFLFTSTHPNSQVILQSCEICEDKDCINCPVKVVINEKAPQISTDPLTPEMCRIHTDKRIRKLKFL